MVTAAQWTDTQLCVVVSSTSRHCCYCYYLSMLKRSRYLRVYDTPRTYFMNEWHRILAGFISAKYNLQQKLVIHYLWLSMSAVLYQEHGVNMTVHENVPRNMGTCKRKHTHTQFIGVNSCEDFIYFTFTPYAYGSQLVRCSVANAFNLLLLVHSGAHPDHVKPITIIIMIVSIYKVVHYCNYIMT